MSDERLPELFDEAIELDEEGRRRLLDRLRLEQPALADELAGLLASPDVAPSPIDVAPELPADDENEAESLPERVGPFRLLREIGKGGMGRVFLAEQETPDFRRTVALKLIHRPGPDADAIRRFRDEVRILATLDHPGIVRFLDGGRSADGIWFLALEYVEGDDLVTHAQRNELGVDPRVRLFVDVVEAVAYAHERGVVHRDLKPGNVLVGRDGRPRLLDFGISKLLDPSSSVGLTTTRHGVRPLTPAYASPEQRAGDPATVASDIYSLGVVLYELLTGRRPVTEWTRDSSGSDPEPPSTAARRAAATGRRSSPTDPTASRSPRRRISRDLDAICLKALRRDPSERYASSAAFATDLRRYLAGEPVDARRGDLRYRLRKLLRRRRIRVAIAAAAVALALAAAIPFLFLRSPEAAKPQAVEAPRAFPFDPVNPPPLEESERRFAESPDDVVAGAALALGLARDQRFAEAQIVLGRLRQIPQRELDPLVDFAEGRIASLQGENQRALVFYTRARDNALALGRTELVPTIRYSRGSILSGLGQRDAGNAELALARDESERAGDPIVLFRSLNELAVDHFQRGELAQGEASLERALAAARAAGLTPIIVLSNLAEVRLLRGRPDLAEPLAREALEHRKRFPSAHREGEELTRLFMILRDLGRSAEAEPMIEKALSLLRPSKNAMSRSAALYSRAQADLASGRLGGLEALAIELEAAAQESLRRRPLGFAHLLRAQVADARGDRAAARERFAESRRLFLLEGDGDLATLASLLGAEAEAAAGEPEAAMGLLEEGLGAFAPASATLPSCLGEMLRARLDAAAGRSEDARRRLAALGDGFASSPSVSGRIAYLRARAALGVSEGRVEDAQEDLRSALEAAEDSGRKVDELGLRLELARLPGRAQAGAEIAEVRREAEALGLRAIADRAH